MGKVDLNGVDGDQVKNLECSATTGTKGCIFGCYFIKKVEKTGQIQIKIIGRKGNFDLNPDNYDIREVIEMLQHVEHLLFPNTRKDRPIISLKITEGSVNHIIQTTLQTVIGFDAILAKIKAENYSIDFLEYPTIRAFEFFQSEAQKNNYQYEICTSIAGGPTISINKGTKFIRSEDIWVDAEFYFYGTIVDAGGKGKANVHLDTKEFGLLKIEATRMLLKDYESNPLYKPYGVRAKGKQNIKSAEIDKGSLILIDIIDYNPSYKEDYIKSLIKKAKSNWSDVNDADEWLQNVRGYGA